MACTGNRAARPRRYEWRSDPLPIGAPLCALRVPRLVLVPLTYQRHDRPVHASVNASLITTRSLEEMLAAEQAEQEVEGSTVEAADEVGTDEAGPDEVDADEVADSSTVEVVCICKSCKMKASLVTDGRVTGDVPQ